MSRGHADTARLLEFALDMGGKISHAFGDALPEDAKHHLLNAQRELITALVIIYEHQAGARRGEPTARARRTTAGGAQSRLPRSRRIRVD